MGLILVNDAIVLMALMDEGLKPHRLNIRPSKGQESIADFNKLAGFTKADDEQGRLTGGVSIP